jgi:hypothetical protein
MLTHTRFASATTLLATALLALMLAPAVQAAMPLQLFGVSLHDASRATLRAAVKKAGLIPVRVDDQYYCDKYAVNGHLKGAKTLVVCYTGKRNRFAYAEYIFPTFMDTALVTRVIAMVKVKYGAPDHLDGDENLGAVTATWNEGADMNIEVSRGWPNTTTYLDLIDAPNKSRMNAEIQADKAQKQKQQAQQQSNAF